MARTHKVPLEMAAIMLIGTVAGAAARRVEVQIGDTHRQPINLYLAIVAESGERKGPPLREALRPLEKIELEVKQAAEPEIRAARERRQIAEARLKHLRVCAAKAKRDTERQAAGDEAERLAREMPGVPAEPKLLVGNVTPEKLEQELAEQGGALMLASEEAGYTFDIAAGRYTKDGGEQLDTLLLAYDGGALRTARITRCDVHAAAPALTILLTPQPAILRRFREHPGFEERGLIPRFIFVLARRLGGTRLYENFPLDLRARMPSRRPYGASSPCPVRLIRSRSRI